jgi:hypothetical protein
MRRSKSMLVLAVLGLASGIPLALQGWGGLQRGLILLQEQGGRLLGGILVVLSLAVLIRQARSAASSRPPAASTPDTTPQGAGDGSQLGPRA